MLHGNRNTCLVPVWALSGSGCFQVFLQSSSRSTLLTLNGLVVSLSMGCRLVMGSNVLADGEVGAFMPWGQTYSAPTTFWKQTTLLLSCSRCLDRLRMANCRNVCAHALALILSFWRVARVFRDLAPRCSSPSPQARPANSSSLRYPRSSSAIKVAFAISVADQTAVTWRACISAPGSSFYLCDRVEERAGGKTYRELQPN